MDHLIPLAVLFAAAPLVYVVVRVGGLDPHHVEATPGWIGSGFRTLLVIASALLFIGMQDKQSHLSHFLAAFVLANVVAVAYTSPDRFREDEYPDAFERFVKSKEGPLAGGLLLGALSAFLYWLTPSYWFHIIAVLGTCLLFGKGVTALAVMRADDGEFKGRPIAFRENKAKYWTPRVFAATAAYPLLAFTVGLELVQAANLHGSGWFGWIGIAGGSLLSVALSDR
jgi:hypothetical protein